MKIDLTSVQEMGKDQLIVLYNQVQEELRQTALQADLTQINMNQSLAIQELKETLNIIQKQLIETNRGGESGMHGFIAEAMETGIGNAKRLFNGDSRIFQWLNDNGPSDIKIGNVDVQMKFYASDDLYGLKACQTHLRAHPDYLKSGAKYQIAKDQYQAMSRIYRMSESEAVRLSRSDPEILKQWQRIHSFFEQPGNMKFKDVMPAQTTLDEVQKKTYQDTIAAEKKAINRSARKQRAEARENHQATLADGLKTAAAGAALEGGLNAAKEIFSHLKDKKITEMTSEDWIEVLQAAGLGALKGGARGGFVFFATDTLNMNSQTAAMAASMLINSAELVYQFKTGNLSEMEMLGKLVESSANTALSCAGAAVGQAVIPVPVIGPLVGSITASFLGQIAGISKDKVIDAELKKLQDSLDVQYKGLNDEYKQYLTFIQQDFEVFLGLLINAFSDDPWTQMKGSIDLASYAGVPEEKILFNMEDGEDYFC